MREAKLQTTRFDMCLFTIRHAQCCDTRILVKLGALWRLGCWRWHSRIRIAKNKTKFKMSKIKGSKFKSLNFKSPKTDYETRFSKFIFCKKKKQLYWVGLG